MPFTRPHQIISVKRLASDVVEIYARLVIDGSVGAMTYQRKLNGRVFSFRGRKYRFYDNDNSFENLEDENDS